MRGLRAPTSDVRAARQNVWAGEWWVERGGELCVGITRPAAWAFARDLTTAIQRES